MGQVQDPNSRQRVLDILNTTLVVVGKTFETVASMKANAGKSFLRKEGDVIQADIAATVGLISNEFVGSMIIAFPKATYLAVMSKMLGQEFTEISPDITDGVAELLNMILGQLKIDLNQKGYSIKPALPTVIQGEKLMVSPTRNKPSIVIPYTSDGGDFFVEVSADSGSM